MTHVESEAKKLYELINPIVDRKGMRSNNQDSLDEVKAITHPGFGGPGRERYRL